jgi:hypothetical protein
MRYDVLQATFALLIPLALWLAAVVVATLTRKTQG